MLESSGEMTPRTQKITSNLNVACDSDGNRVRIDVCRNRLYIYDRCRVPAMSRRPSASIAHGPYFVKSSNAQMRPNAWRDCSISPRQAYRYLEQAQQLKAPVPPGESKLAFTVKLPRGLIQRVREYATKKRLSISEVVSRALLALLPRGRGRG